VRALYWQGLIWIALLQAGGARSASVWLLEEEGCLPADGGPAVELALYAAQAQALERLEAKGQLGKFGPVRPAGGGLYYLLFYPPSLNAIQKSAWSISWQANGGTASTDFEMKLCPFPAGRVNLSAQPEHLIAGEGQQAILSIEVLDELDQPDHKARLDLTVNTGEIKNLRQVKPGFYQAVYLPPGDPFPQIAIVMAVNAASARFGRLAVGRVIIPITARIELPGKTTPGTSMTMNIAGRSFGPIKPDERGNFLLPVLIPPGVKRGLATSTDRAGNRTSRWVDFFLPPTNQLGLWVYPRRLAADGLSTARILVTTMEADGRPLDTEKIKLEVDAGRVEGLHRVGSGMLEARYVAPRLPSGGQARLSVSFFSGGSRSRAEATVELLAAPVRDLTVEAPTSLPADGRSRRALRVTALGAEKLPVGGKLLTLRADRLQAEPAREISAGIFESYLIAPPRPELWQARLEIELQENPGQQPDHLCVPRGALSQRGAQYLMECFLLDQSNRPVADQEIELSLFGQRLSAKTNAFGRAEFLFTPPADEKAPRLALFSLPGTEIKQGVFLVGVQGQWQLLEHGLSAQKPLSEPLRREFTLQLYPPPPVEIDLQAQPQGNGYLIEAKLERAGGGPPADLQLHFLLSSGRIVSVNKLAPGRFQAFVEPGPPGWKKIYITASPEGESSAAFLELVEGEGKP